MSTKSSTRVRKTERKPPRVYPDIMAAVVGSGGDRRPVWSVSVGSDCLFARASSPYQARKAVLEKVTTVVRLKQGDINRILQEMAIAALENSSASSDQQHGVGDA